MSEILRNTWTYWTSLKIILKFIGLSHSKLKPKQSINTNLGFELISDKYKNANIVINCEIDMYA